MKNIKKLLVLLMALCLIAGVTACHQKGEIAVKVGDKEFTSGYYACVLYFTDSEARSKVQTQLSKAGEDTSNIDYYSQQIDGKDYVDWVKEETLNSIKKIAASQIYCERNNLTPEESELTNTVSYAEYYWENYYSETLTKNGVAKETFIKYMKDSLYEELYFDHIFGAEGEKAVTEEQIKNEITSNLVLADVLSFDLSTSDSDEGEEATDNDAVNEQINGYYNDLKAGKRTFEEIYYEKTGTEKTETTEDSDTPAPEDSLATMIGKPDTDYAGTYSDYYEEIVAMQTGEVKIIESKDGATKYIVVKKDILADTYYYTTYEDTFRHALADGDFDKLVAEYLKDLSFEEISYATDNFKVKDIYYAS